MAKFNPYDHFGFLTNRIGRLLSKRFREKLAKKGYESPASCIGILADLWAHDGINQKELGVSLIKTKSSINKMLTALEEDELIKKVNDPNDGRSKLIYLTNKGKKMKDKVVAESQNEDLRLLNHVTKEELQITKNVLSKYYELLCTESCNHKNPHINK